MYAVILSDSMAMPRPWIDEGERTTLSEVYAGLLRERYRGAHDVDLLYVISLDSENAAVRYHRMVSYRQADVAILHLGINDCAPRVFGKGNKHLFLQPWFRKLTRDAGLNFVHRHRRRLTKMRKLRYVEPDDFERNLHTVITETRKQREDTRILAIAIAEGSEKLASRSHGYVESVREYNEILRRVFGPEYVEVNDLLPKSELYISDGYHLSKQAHALLAERLAERLDDVFAAGVATGEA